MLSVGDPLPEATVWVAPREPATLREVAPDRPMLLLFYLFDWSST